MYQRNKIIFDWIVVLAVYLCVLLIIPISNKLFIYLRLDASGAVLNIIVNFAASLVFLCLLAYLLKQGSRVHLSSYVWLVIFFVISISFLIKVKVATDKLHFLGYGILSLLIYRALRHNIGTALLYLWTSIFIMLFAILDETLQIFSWTSRSFEIKDILTDWLSSLMGQFIIALVIRPKLEAVQIKIRHYAKKIKELEIFKYKHRIAK